MDALIRYGFSVEEIKNIMNSNEDINNISDNDINKIIKLLEKCNCKINHIKNIFITNPFVLTRDYDEIEKSINILNDNLKDVFLVLDTNPFILNISDKEIGLLINELVKKNIDVNDYFLFNANEII